MVSNGSSFPSEYTSLQDILTLNQRVPCKFKVHGLKLGFIDPSSESQDIPCGTKLEIPLWLAKELYRRDLIEIDVPKGYNETYREILDADSTVVDLHKLGPNYYKFGTHLAQMGLNDSEDIAKSLVGTFYQRLHKIMDFALSTTPDTLSDMLQFQSSLDNDEQDVFNFGKRSAEEYKLWENRNLDKITANELVANLKKRKRIALEVEGKSSANNVQSSSSQSAQ